MLDEPLLGHFWCAFYHFWNMFQLSGNHSIFTFDFFAFCFFLENLSSSSIYSQLLIDLGSISMTQFQNNHLTLS